MIKNNFEYTGIISIAFLVLINVGCAGLTEYKISQTSYEHGNYEWALMHINLALKEDPNNEKYIKLKSDIKEKIYLKLYEKTEEEFKLIPKENLDKKIQKLEEKIKIGKELNAINSSKYSSSKDEFELGRVFFRKNQIEGLIKEIKDDFKNTNYIKALKDLTTLMPYKDYLDNVSEIHAYSIRYLPHFDSYLSNEFQRKRFNELEKFLNLIDLAFLNNEITGKYRKKISDFYKNKGNLFLDNGKISTAYFYFLQANKFNKNAIDNSLLESLHKKLKDYNENLFIELRGNIEQNKLSSFNTLIFDGVSKSCGHIFHRTQTPKNSTVSILMSIDRIEHNIESSNQQLKYSKYITGYQTVPNQIYYTAKAKAEQAQNELLTLSLQQCHGWGCIVQDIAKVVQQNELNDNLKIMNSPGAFDNVPIYIDYTYTESNIKIKNLVQLSYKIYDMKNKTLFKKDKINKENSKNISILNNVHPADAYGLKNSEEFNFNAERNNFDDFVQNSVNELKNKIASEITDVFGTRAIEYYEMDEISEAIDSYLTGAIIKNNYDIKLLNEIQILDILPTNLQENFDILTPESNLGKKLAKREKLSLEGWDESIKTENLEEKKVLVKMKFTESDIPALIKDTNKKVVLIKSIGNSGISQGSGFLVSSNGYIITNFHVVSNSNNIIIKMYDGSEFSAQIIMSDSFADLAALKIQIANAPFFALDTYEKVVVGETIIAIGAPHGYEETVSRGIVSAKRKNFPLYKNKELSVIQTDALMTHGNSGGPLVNLNGKVIGVNTFTENIEGTPGALNFAISSDEIIKRFPFVINK